MPRYSRNTWEMFDVPKYAMDLADKRTKGFDQAMLLIDSSLKTLMRSCYLQGVADGYEVAEKKGDTL